MKKIYGIISLVAVLISCGENTTVEIGNKTTIEVSPEMYDAGEILKGEVVNAKFTVKNTGNYPLVIGEVKGSCSCTVAEYPDAPIQPGEEGEVLAYVNTDQLGVGTLNKAVRIVANTEPSITQVTIRADVMRK